MAGELESLGEAVTGGMLARAVEPLGQEVTVGRDGHTHETACLNCGTRLRGEFCHACGQHAHVHRTLGAFGHDLLHGVLHLEGKIWRTLPLLMFRPGELTRRYINGERARFVSPLALFLFSVFTMFAVMSLLGSPINMLDGAERGAAREELLAELAETDKKIIDLRAQREAAAQRGADTGKMDEELRGAEMGRNVIARLAGEDGNEGAEEAKPPPNTPQFRVKADPGTPFDTLYKTAKQNPKLLAYKLQTNAYKFSWALIIISVPFVALLFLWRWRPLYDHTVFVTYSITAVSILAIVGSLLVIAGMQPEPVWLAATLFIPWHMYRQLRGGYQLRRFSALWRTFALVLFAISALSLFAFGLLMLGVLG